MMQLLNPHFNGSIKIYNDPFANETNGIGVAGFQVTGGHEKSYYIVKGDEVGFRLYKKKFKKAFEDLLGDCSAVKISKKPDWKELAGYVATYNENCEGK